MNLLITGGAGYIGSIANRYLRDLGHQTVVFDNLTTGHKVAVGDTKLIVGDLKNPGDIEKAFEVESFDAVIHFAALALAGESMDKPAEYFINNILGGTNLLEAMQKAECKTIIFSSTCAVYGLPEKLPVTENESYKPVSVYGSSKRMLEEVLEWYDKIYGIKYVNLRYFNAAGALLDGTLGEAHNPETHIIPKALDAAAGNAYEFQLYGGDYKSPDGTCIRDYIHVLDLADAHIKAVEYLIKGGVSMSFNLGAGKGYSNKEVLSMVEKVTGKKISVKVVPRRIGDPDAIFADNTKAKTVLGWNPIHSNLETIVKSAWDWHQKLK